MSIKHLTTLTQSEIITAFRKQKIFGAVEVDIHVPDHLLDKFQEMSPIFCNANIPFESLGDFSQETVKKLNLSEAPRRLLVEEVCARKILLASLLLKWYLEYGLIVSRVYQVIELTPIACFSDFTNEANNARRRGDRDPRFEIFADTLKLIGNSVNGSMIVNKEKHMDITYRASKEKAGYFVSKKRFRSHTELDNDHFEIELAKNRLNLDLPIQIGYFVLQYAKLRMPEFYFDCIDKFCSRQDFEFMSMDTDSLYMAISADNLVDIIKPKIKISFEQESNRWFPPEAASFDRRQPGLFKEEFAGTAMVAICTKNSLEIKKSKFSCKGLNKNNFSNPLSLYKRILFENSRAGEKKSRFPRAKQHYLTSFYPKRKVLSDGVTPTYLEIELCLGTSLLCIYPFCLVLRITP